MFPTLLRTKKFLDSLILFHFLKFGIKNRKSENIILNFFLRRKKKKGELLSKKVENKEQNKMEWEYYKFLKNININFYLVLKLFFIKWNRNITN